MIPIPQNINTLYCALLIQTLIERKQNEEILDHIKITIHF
jgi:hypothetical protein